MAYTDPDQQMQGYSSQKKLTVYTDSIPDTPFYEDDFETTEWNQILAPLDENTGSFSFCIIWKVLTPAISARF